MTRISRLPILLGLVGLVAFAAHAEAQRGNQGRPSGGGRPSIGSSARPSAPSRPAASISRSSAPSRPSASWQRGSAAPAQRPSAPPPSARPAPQPSAPAPRYEAPRTPPPVRSTPAPAPRYEAPQTPQYRQPDAPRYEQPSTPRYEQPAAPRSTQPVARTPYRDGGFETGGRSDGPGAGRQAQPGSPDPARFDRAEPTPYLPRVWQPAPVVDLSGAILPPRTPVPTLSGSRSGNPPEGGLASGRLSRAGIEAGRSRASLPQPEVTRDSLRARYGVPADAAPGRGLRSADTTGPANGRVRGIDVDGATRTRGSDAGGRRSAATKPGRSAERVGANELVGTTERRLDAADREQPGTARRFRETGTAIHRTLSTSTGISVGVGVGFYTGWFCDPWSYGYWDNCGPYWNTCWSSPWWWSWSWYWPYGSCWWGGWRSWPYYGYYGSYYGYGWWCPPAVYTTVIYRDYQQPAVTYETPAPEIQPAVHAQPAAGAAPQAAPEIRAANAATADEWLAEGDLAFREGRYSDAVRHYARAVEFAPERGDLWLILSDALFATGDYHYAAYALRKSLDLDGTLLEPLVDKHDWYGNPAEFDKHIAWAEAYLRDHVLDEDARLVLAANYLFSQRWSQAVDCMSSAFGAALRETKAGRLVQERSQRALEIATGR